MIDLSGLALKSILLLDDDEASLDRYSRFLSDASHVHVTRTRHPTQALQLAAERLYDFVLIDVSINFHGNSFGGLEVYKTLRPRYGQHSLIAYSKYITDAVLHRYDLRLNFVEHSGDPLKFVEGAATKMGELRSAQTCFVAMPFDSDYASLFEAIRQGTELARYRCLRLDEKAFTNSVSQRILREIDDAKVLLFIASGRNPNAFFEAGYAFALRKEVVVLVDSVETLPFDLQDKKCLTYGNDPASAQGPIREFLERLTLQA